MKKFEQKHRVSVERVISGTGIANIYEFLMFKFPEKVNPEIKTKVRHNKILYFYLFILTLLLLFSLSYLLLFLFLFNNFFFLVFRRW